MIHLWLLIVPQSQFLARYIMAKDIYKPSTFNILQKRDYNPYLDKLIDQILYTDTRPYALDVYAEVESSNNPKAKNPKSTAKGIYQITDDTVDTIKNRMKNMGIKKSFRNKYDDNPINWTRDESDIALLVKIFSDEVKKGEKTHFGLKGKKGLIDSLSYEAFINDDMNSIKDLYYTKWHTNPSLKDKLNFERGRAEVKIEKTKTWLHDYIKSFFK
jgi:hypothetical protein